MKDSAKQHETWVIAAAIVAFLATFAGGLFALVDPGREELEEIIDKVLIPLLTASLTGMGIGGATLIKRSAQRGEQAGAAAAPAVEQIRSTIQDILAQERAAPDKAKLTLDDHKHPEHRSAASADGEPGRPVPQLAVSMNADGEPVLVETPHPPQPASPSAIAALEAVSADSAPTTNAPPESPTEPARTAPPPTDGARSGEQAGDG